MTRYVSFVGEIEVDKDLTARLGAVVRRHGERWLTDDGDYWKQITQGEIAFVGWLAASRGWKVIGRKDTLSVTSGQLFLNGADYTVVWVECAAGGWHSIIVLPLGTEYPKVVSPAAVPAGCEVNL